MQEKHTLLARDMLEPEEASKRIETIAFLAFFAVLAGQEESVRNLFPEDDTLELKWNC